MKLSIAMMVKNQSKHLDECLKSLQAVREKIDSELIIVDTGSEDDTVDIAKRYTDKVYFHEWTGNFAEMRNISISYTSGDWVFIIDGDEVIENADPLINFFKKGIYKNYNTALIIVRSFSNDRYDAYFDACLPRLFKKTAELKYEGAIHEQPVVSLPVCKIDLLLLHYGYITTDEKLMEYKFKRNVDMLKKELARDPENIYYWFQLSQSYGMHRDFKDAMEAIDTAYNLLKQKGKDLKDYYYVLHHRVYVYNLNGKYRDTEKLCHEAIKIKDGYIDIYYHLGKAQMNLGKYEEAVKSFNTYLTMLEYPEKFTGKNDATLTHYTLQAYEEIYRDMVLLHEVLGNYNEALLYAEKINDKSFLASAFPGIIKAYIKNNRITGLKDYFNNVVKEKFPELKNDFIISLENIKYKEFDIETQNKLTEVFSAGDEDYALLNMIRLHEDKDMLDSNLIESIKDWDFAALPAVYGDVLYYLMKKNVTIQPFFDNLMEKYLIGCIEYISDLHKDTATVIYEYLSNVMSHAESIDGLNMIRALERCALLLDGLDERQYRYVFNRYIKDGTEFINNIYNREVIENETVHLVKTEEDAFLIYMVHAEQNKTKNPLKYVQYLRKALKVYPNMKKGIELLLDELKKEEEPEEKNLEEYKKIFKEKIKKHVESGALDLSLQLINEYKKLVGEDADTCSIEAVIAMMEGKLDDAEQILNRGLNMNGNNFDLLYNKAYLHQLKDDSVQALKYYKKAVLYAPNPEMKNLINESMKELGSNLQRHGETDAIQQVDTIKESQVDELEYYKQALKDIIQANIYKGQLTEAEELIKEYESIIPDDLELYSMKSVIAMMDQRMEEAEYIIKNGLKRDPSNVDLLYNYAYLCQITGDLETSICYYQKAYDITKDAELKQNIEDNINQIKARKSDLEVKGGKQRVKVLIGSPVCQKPEILKEFLKSLNELKKINFEAHYMFIVDNRDAESSELLLRFSETTDNVLIKKVQNDDTYVCDNDAYHCKENLMWKVAGFKNDIIQEALVRDYDYLFLVDSDLVLHPNTVEQLISVKKDIISSIFWTQWEPHSPVVPQVWLWDENIQYEIRPGESITIEDALVRQHNFIKEMKRPGTYKVGGVGGCILISRKAIRSGVNFSPINNLSFRGEDKHFCVRAAVLGFELFVDTHYPSYHIHRDSDLDGVIEYKQKNRMEISTLKKTVSLVYMNLSGSNTVALYKLMPQCIKNKYYIQLVKYEKSYDYYRKIIDSDLILITEANYLLKKELFNKNQIVIDLWHGFPLKAMGYVDKGEKWKDALPSIWENTDFIVSYSELFNELMNRCVSTDEDKYKILGVPRNDFLFKSNGKKLLSDILEENLQDRKIIFYMPTFRSSSMDSRVDGSRNWSNIFDFECFDDVRFDSFLDDNDLTLVIKLHPKEESVVKNCISQMKNIKMLTSDHLNKKGIDLYEILNSADLLITDYSSVYFDFLLLDKPIIFTPTDIDQYDSSRGFLLKPYDAWTPGPKVLDQNTLQSEIINSLKIDGYYSEERARIRDLAHKYKDGESSKRVWNFISELLDR